MSQSLSVSRSLKWKEVYSLAFLNAAVAISWIAYHEYQPELLSGLALDHYVDFLLITKALVLVLIPPVAGWIADRIFRKNGKYLIVFSVGIGATAMVFMIVASLIGSSHLVDIRAFLPVMIVLWLICMNLFISPANSMIEAFAPIDKLPVVVGVLFLVTELVYALEPVIVALVSFFGDTLTFVVGGVLIGASGFLFHRVSSDEVLQRKAELRQNDRVKTQSINAYMAIVVVGFFLGIGKAFLVEFLPNYIGQSATSYASYGQSISFGILGLCAVAGFLISRVIKSHQLSQVIIYSFVVLVVGIVTLLFAPIFEIKLVGSLIIAAAFTMVNISGLPFAIRNLSVRHVTYGVGIYLGASEIMTGLFEYFLHTGKI
jgi:MFS family permease